MKIYFYEYIHTLLETRHGKETTQRKSSKVTQETGFWKTTS